MKKHNVGKPVGASAIVTVTIKIKVPSSWGPDCTVAQVHRQAAEGAIGMLRNSNINRDCMQIIGEPSVSTVITER